jgi:hypothetical protein
MDFFLSSLFWASMILLAFFAILMVADLVITWKGLPDHETWWDE